MSKQKQPSYDAIRHELETMLLNASPLAGEQAKQAFVTQTFVWIHQQHVEKLVTHADYVRLANRLAAFSGGAFNDYIDMLMGAATVGMLEMVVRESTSHNLAAKARQQQGIINHITGTSPVAPDGYDPV